jgi:hypothetical protein
MSLTVSAGISVTARMTGVPDLGTTLASLSKSYSVSLVDGALAGMANELYHKQRTLAASATEDLDLAGAVLLDPLAGAASFARIKGIVIKAADANTNNVVVGAASANPWVGLLGSATCAIVVRPGTVWAAFCGAADATGYVVTPGTGDLLKVANSGGTTGVTYDIILYGTIT